jgi:hypothetical protein
MQGRNWRNGLTEVFIKVLGRIRAMSQEALKTPADAKEWIERCLADFANGGADRCEECLRIGADLGLGWVAGAVRRARSVRRARALRQTLDAARAIDQEVRLAREQTVNKPDAPKSDRERLNEYLAKKAAQGANPEPEPPRKPEEPEPEAKPKAKAEPFTKGPTRHWTEVKIPSNVGELERLTYVPGVVGDIVEWIVKGAIRPNRMMALRVATVVVGTLIGRRTMGPTGSATHLYVIILGPTGFGKDWPLKCGSNLMIGVGASALLGPHGFASAPGLENRMARNPLMLCFVDEFGDELALIGNQNNNPFVSMLFGTFTKTYNAWYTIIIAEKVDKECVTIEWPAVSIVGAAAPEKFFRSLRPGDLESGFANRLLILPFEGMRKPPEQEVVGEDEPPRKLVEGLRSLRKAVMPGAEDILAKTDPSTLKSLKPDRLQIGWAGDGAKEVYYALSKEMDRLEEGDPKHGELAKRVGENAIRLATVMAVGRGSGVVNRQDMEWAKALAKGSFDGAVGGFDKWVHEYYELPRFCEEVLAKLAMCGGWRSRRDLERDFRSNKRFGHELDKVFQQLVAEERIALDTRSAAVGRSSVGYKLVKE